jgi:hypothetical protein
MGDAAFAARVRKASLALAEIVDPAGLYPILARRPGPRSTLDDRRPKIGALVEPLNAARSAGDTARWDALIDQLGAHFEAIREAYVAAAVDPKVKARMNTSLDDMIRGGHRH